MFDTNSTKTHQFHCNSLDTTHWMFSKRLWTQFIYSNIFKSCFLKEWWILIDLSINMNWRLISLGLGWLVLLWSFMIFHVLSQSFPLWFPRCGFLLPPVPKPSRFHGFLTAQKSFYCKRTPGGHSFHGFLQVFGNLPCSCLHFFEQENVSSSTRGR